MEIQLPSPVLWTLEQLNRAGYEAYIVGGCVRDSVMGHSPSDWDITTSALPHEIMAALDGVSIIPTGIVHGTVTALVEGTPLEITTYRIDGEYADSRHPSQVSFTKALREDLSRRDFTMNAMAYHPHKGLVDYFDGQKDIASHIIRCVGDPSVRFREDALRIMRCIRFASTLGFSLDAATKEAVLAHCASLNQIAVERIYMELTKLICGANVYRVLMDYAAVLFAVIPELSVMYQFGQNNPYHLYDVYEHTAHSVACAAPILAVRLTMLLHDVGKPSCYTQDEQGVGHFWGHPEVSVEIAAKVLTRLRADKETATLVKTLVLYHDVTVDPNPTCVKRWLHRLTPETLRLLLYVQIADGRAQNPVMSCRQMEAVKALELMDRIVREKQCFSLPDLAVTGKDLMALGIPPSKELGQILQLLLEAVIAGSCPNDPRQLLEKAKEFYSSRE